ncbi:short-chain dehydrogenase/reductase [Hoyosella subflava]|uniref:Putative short chain dehydrogenase n=1 Tax=Hoyosella subflava (strain DSM 45089 / JCM 17490 / NBRC 109087 / DQS3-9A1) TaxID=443218 RepID=F6EL96_HOYSD|nr:short-chain dehydrogenase/reductase [Hoyosella subflava]AEF39188.1 Putative short chain dehydrogenase [Hoyosella subflava DQS3-9A1]
MTSTALDVRGKVALVTGGGGGIGFEVARHLADRGARVAIFDVDEAAAIGAAEAIGQGARGLGVNVADREAMTLAVKKIQADLGPVAVVVANAGVTPQPATLRLMDDAEFDRVVGINLTGVYNTVRPVLDDIVATRGHVVIVASVAAFAPGMGGSPYMITKAAVEQLGRALRIELAVHGASAQVAYFGIVETAMTRAMLDEDELGRELGGRFPWPFNRRISATDAAKALCEGIANRSARTIVPRVWTPYAILRGVINIGFDAALVRDTRTHRMVTRLESQLRGA